MVKAKKVKRISARTVAAFGAQAKTEWAQLEGHFDWFYSTCHRIWTLSVDGKPMCVLGLKKNTALGFGCEIFFMLCRNFSHHAKKVAKFIRRATRRVVKLYGRLTVRVDEDFWIGDKFVKFFGFRDKGTATGINGNRYKYYELRALWL